MAPRRRPGSAIFTMPLSRLTSRWERFWSFMTGMGILHSPTTWFGHLRCFIARFFILSSILLQTIVSLMAFRGSVASGPLFVSVQTFMHYRLLALLMTCQVFRARNYRRCLKLIEEIEQLPLFMTAKTAYHRRVILMVMVIAVGTMIWLLLGHFLAGIIGARLETLVGRNALGFYLFTPILNTDFMVLHYAQLALQVFQVLVIYASLVLCICHLHFCNIFLHCHLRHLAAAARAALAGRGCEVDWSRIGETGQELTPPASWNVFDAMQLKRPNSNAWTLKTPGITAKKPMPIQHPCGSEEEEVTDARTNIKAWSPPAAKFKTVHELVPVWITDHIKRTAKKKTVTEALPGTELDQEQDNTRRPYSGKVHPQKHAEQQNDPRILPPVFLNYEDERDRNDDMAYKHSWKSAEAEKDTWASPDSHAQEVVMSWAPLLNGHRKLTELQEQVQKCFSEGALFTHGISLVNMCLTAYIFIQVKFELDWVTLMANAVFLLSAVACIFFESISCDFVRSANQDVYRLQHGGSWARLSAREASVAGELMRRCRTPMQLTAMNYFNVSKRNFGSLLSLTVTYIVILVQFSDEKQQVGVSSGVNATQSPAFF